MASNIKIKTVEQLEELLVQDLAWRKKEMIGKKIAKMIMGVYILSVVNLSTLTQELPFVDSYPFETIIAQSERSQESCPDAVKIASSMGRS